MTHTLRVVCEFAAGHRLWGTGITCDFPHGHSFTAELMVEASALASSGMVVDFDLMREVISSWITANWDHAFLINSNDTELLGALNTLRSKKIFVFDDENPTAEVLARTLYDAVLRDARFRDIITAVRIWENASQYAEYRL